MLGRVSRTNLVLLLTAAALPGCFGSGDTDGSGEDGTGGETAATSSADAGAGGAPTGPGTPTASGSGAGAPGPSGPGSGVGGAGPGPATGTGGSDAEGGGGAGGDVGGGGSQPDAPWDGTVHLEGIDGKPLYDWFPSAVSPDGTAIAFLIVMGQGNSELVIVDRAAGDVRRTPLPSDDVRPRQLAGWLDDESVGLVGPRIDDSGGLAAIAVTRAGAIAWREDVPGAPAAPDVAGAAGVVDGAIEVLAVATDGGSVRRLERFSFVEGDSSRELLLELLPPPQESVTLHALDDGPRAIVRRASGSHELRDPYGVRCELEAAPGAPLDRDVFSGQTTLDDVYLQDVGGLYQAIDDDCALVGEAPESLPGSAGAITTDVTRHLVIERQVGQTADTLHAVDIDTGALAWEHVIEHPAELGESVVTNPLASEGWAEGEATISLHAFYVSGFEVIRPLVILEQAGDVRHRAYVEELGAEGRVVARALAARLDRGEAFVIVQSCDDEACGWLRIVRIDTATLEIDGDGTGDVGCPCEAPDYCDNLDMCQTACEGRECGTHQGISCGECSEGDVCTTQTGQCRPACEGLECGTEAGVECGTCGPGTTCDDGTFQCIPSPGGIRPLGFFAGTDSSSPLAMDDDGDTVVGILPLASCSRAGRWTQATQWTRLPCIPGDASAVVRDISGDGQVIIGTSSLTNGGGFGEDPVRWIDGDVEELEQPGFFSETWEVSRTDADGSAIAGTIRYQTEQNGDFSKQAVLWGPGIELLDQVPGGSIEAVQIGGISSDGSRVVGREADAAGGVAALWASSNVTTLGRLPGDLHSAATAISGDGTVVFGTSQPAGGDPRPFRWTSATGMQILGSGVPRCTPSRASTNGSVVVGSEQTAGAVVWMGTHDCKPILELLTDAGHVLDGWTFHSGVDVTADGSTVLVSATNPQGQTEAVLVDLP